MKYLDFLLAANLVVWVAIFGYLMSLIKKNNSLNAELNLLKESLLKKEKTANEK